MPNSTIVINGQEHRWTNRYITYDDIARIVGVRAPTVAISSAFGVGSRSLCLGQRTVVDNGMIIDAVNTSSA